MKTYTLFYAGHNMQNISLVRILQFLWTKRNIAVGTEYANRLAQLNKGESALFCISEAYPSFTILRVE